MLGTPLDRFIAFTRDQLQIGDLTPDQLLSFLRRMGYIPDEDILDLPSDEVDKAFARFCIEDELFHTASETYPLDLLVRIVGGDSDYSGKADYLRELFEGLQIPTQPDVVEAVQLGFYKKKLEDAGNKINFYIRRNDPHGVHSNVLDLWNWSDRILKVMLVFYQKVFERFLDPMLDDAFRSAVSERNWGNRLSKIEKIEEIFQVGETSKERRDRQTTLRKRVEGVENEEAKNELITENQNYEQERKTFARGLQIECWFRWGRMTPFEPLDRAAIKAAIRIHRNPPAHDPSEELWQERGPDYARRSRRAANDIFNSIEEENLFPTVVFPVCIGGEDIYGRRWVGFLNQFESDWASTMHWFYLKPDVKFNVLTPYLTVHHPDRFVVYDPWMVPLEEVIEGLESL